uniref:Uncharacterized protein n=1 Tax=Mola mola TaxID=94237 RepID=A0A3Q3VQY4_MOLML
MLTDIKRLKVAEIRSRLTELGLDNKGLKAELIGRLWSALEATQSGQDGKETDEEPQNVTPAALHAEAGVTARCKVDRAVTELKDSATQTESDPGVVPTPQPEPELVSASVLGSRAGEGEAGHRRTLSAEERGRGRAFYEFKEEIRYKRSLLNSPLLPLCIDDAHLHFEVGPGFSCGQPRFWDRYPSLWSGCRLTHGVLRGRVGFEVRLERTMLATQLEEQEVLRPHGLRVGWSIVNTSILLGEDEFSFAYDDCGKKVSAGTEEEFGEPFSVGDIIGCYAVNGAVELTFYKNGRFMGAAFSLSPSGLRGRALFPHVLCKSCSVRLHLDPTAPPWYAGPEGFTPLAALSAEQAVRATMAPTSRAQCEVLLMVGLPGSGKSHWARTHIMQHPHKQYRLLGTEELLACMIVSKTRDSRLQQASQCLTELIRVAAQTPGNYILDQCNILFSARRHKLQLFTGFRRQVVVVFPSADEWKRRLSRHLASEGEQIPETALLKLQVSYSLPEQQSDLLEELRYVELPQEKAQTLLQEYKDEAHRLLPPVPKQEKNPRLQKKRPHSQCECTSCLYFIPTTTIKTRKVIVELRISQWYLEMTHLSAEEDNVCGLVGLCSTFPVQFSDLIGCQRATEEGNQQLYVTTL